MKLFSSIATTAALLLASAAASGPALRGPDAQSLHESVWTPEFSLPLATTPITSKFMTIPLFGDLSSTELFNFYGLVTIGTPPQHFKMHIETTESLIAIPNFMPPSESQHRAFYNHSISSSYEGDGMNVMSFKMWYSYFGYFSRDTIRFGDFELANMSFAEVIKIVPSDFAGLQVDGLLGLGLGADYFANSVLQQLLRTGAISKPVFTFHFNKTQETGGRTIGKPEPASIGEVTIGAIDKRHYSGHIHYVNTLTDSVWTVKLDAVTVHGKSVVSGTDWLRAVVAPSYPFILGPNADIEKLAKVVGATEGDTIDCSPQGPDIVIKIGGVKYTFTKAEYTRRVDDKTCRWVFTGQNIGGWMLGQPFLQKFFSVFEFPDEQSKAPRIGFALAA